MPGLLTPWYVPMIPDALIVALSGSVSNHWSRNSERAHRHELDEDRLLALREPLEAPGEAGQRHQRARIEAGQVGRGDGQDRLDEPGHLDHQLAVFLVRLGVAGRPAAQLADRPAVVVHPPQVVAAAGCRAFALVQRRDRPVEGQDVQAVLRQLEIADDLGPEQGHDVAEDARTGSPGRSPR